jgi:cytochrome c-type biogenesis protein
MVAGTAVGLLAYASLPAFQGYVGGVGGLVESVVAARGPGLAASLSVAFLVGASMNFLPCNLPIVMSLLPATTREETRSGFARKTALYGVGAVAVLAALGVVLGALGRSVRPLLVQYRAVGAVVAAVVVGGVGALSVLWGLREFDLVSLPAVGAGVGDALRGAVDVRKGANEYVLLGAVYGGTGGGCPMPTYQLLLAWVVVAASPLYGAVVLGTYALGRVLPVAVVGAVLREHPRRATDVFGGRYGTLRAVNGTVLLGGGSLLVVFTAARVVAEVA